MQRSSQRSQQDKSHGERDQVAVSTQEARGSAQLHLNPRLQRQRTRARARDSERVSIPLERGWPEGTLVYAHMRS